MRRRPMKMNERVAMVQDWAKNDARWIVDRDEGKYKWERIRFDTIGNWNITPAQIIRLRTIYVEMTEKLVKERRSKKPRKYIAVSD